MDKWDELVNRVKQGILAEEPDAALAGGLQLIAEVGRTLEQIAEDLDRIATSIEREAVEISGSTEPPVLDL
jgi:hypothetical protein